MYKAIKRDLKFKNKYYAILPRFIYSIYTKIMLTKYKTLFYSRI